MEFADYVREHRGTLTIFATVLTGQPWFAEDLVSDVLGKVFERWSHIGGLEHPHAYVRRMVINEYLGSRRRFRRVTTSADLRDYDQPVESSQAAHAARDEMLARLAALPDRQRAALVLRYYLDLSNAEIATELGCREVTVRGYISRGLSRLRIDFAEPPRTRPRDEHDSEDTANDPEETSVLTSLLGSIQEELR